MNCSSEIAIREIDLSDAGIWELKAFFQLVWPNARHLDEAYISWMYGENPLGKIVGYNAFMGPRLIGHYAAQPIEASLFGSVERGLLSFNTAVHPEYRGMNLFKKLAAETYEFACGLNYRFVVGVSNAKSTLLFQRQLKFQIVSPLLAKVGVGKFPTERKGNIQFERIWRPATLTWRLNHPRKHYRLDSANCVTAPSGKPGISAILCSLSPEEIPGNIKKSVCAAPLRLWIGLDPGYCWRRAWYFNVPDRLKPSPLNLIFKDLTDAKRNLAADSTKFRLLDFDAY